MLTKDMLSQTLQKRAALNKKAFDWSSLTDAWNGLSTEAKSSIIGGGIGTGLGALTWLVRPKDRDQDQRKELLRSVLGGLAAGGLAGYGFSKLKSPTAPAAPAAPTAPATSTTGESAATPPEETVATDVTDTTRAPAAQTPDHSQINGSYLDDSGLFRTTRESIQPKELPTDGKTPVAWETIQKLDGGRVKNVYTRAATFVPQGSQPVAAIDLGGNKVQIFYRAGTTGKVGNKIIYIPR